MRIRSDFLEVQAINFFKFYWFQMVLVAVIGYLIGSVSFSILFTRQFKNKEDIRNLGSGNAGFTNVLRSVGFWPAFLTMLGDFSKGIIACLFGKMIFSQINLAGVPTFCIVQYGMYIAGVACLAGHVYPCFFELRGGKDVFTAFSMLIMTDWQVAALSFAVFLIIVFTTRLVSLGSILAAVAYPVFTFCITYFCDYLGDRRPATFGYTVVVTTAAVLISVFVIYKHKKNLTRLLNGEEKKLTVATK